MDGDIVAAARHAFRVSPKEFLYRVNSGVHMIYVIITPSVFHLGGEAHEVALSAVGVELEHDCGLKSKFNCFFVANIPRSCIYNCAREDILDGICVKTVQQYKGANVC